MAFEFSDAERKRAYARVAMVGPSGSGKTMSALRMAFGLTQNGKVGVIDTERSSAELYVNGHEDIGKFKHGNINAPFTCAKYGEALDAYVKFGCDVIVIDSGTHAWAGEGGLLEKKDNIAAAGKGNTYTAWREPTKDYNWLLGKILECPAHVIFTMRAKQDYVQDVENGKTVVRKVGMGAVQRDGIEYEFTMVFDIDQSHTACANTKNRTPLFKGEYITLGKKHGKQLLDWLMDTPEDEKHAAITGAQEGELKRLMKAKGKTIPGVEDVSTLTMEKARQYIIRLAELPDKVEEVVEPGPVALPAEEDHGARPVARSGANTKTVEKEPASV